MSKKMLRILPLILLAPLTVVTVGCTTIKDGIVENETTGKIRIEGNLDFGKVEITGVEDSSKLTKGDKITVKVTPNADYDVASVYVNDKLITDTLTFTIEDPNIDYVIKVTFELKPWDVIPDPEKPNPEPEPDPDPDIPTPEPDPDPDKPEPEKPVDPSKKTETVEGVTYTFEEKLVVEKIYDEKYIGASVDYSGTNLSEFYSSNYKTAMTYNDSIARSSARLLSGDIIIPKNIANYKNIKNPKSITGPVFYNARARYIYDTPSYNNVIGYIINDTDGDDSNDTIIYKGGAYISMDEVSAYLFAFNEVPVNWMHSKSNSAKRDAISNWGTYGRVNNGFFSGNVQKYPFQPVLTGIDTVYKYRETDFGTDGDFLFYNQGGTPNVKQSPYNDGHTLNRGTCRFCYSCTMVDTSSIAADAVRHVFYTWSHYNDFEEYLNYKGGYGPKFGNLVVGNEYNTKNPVNPVSQPPEYILATFGK